MSIKQYIKRGIIYIFKGTPIQQTFADVRVLAPSEMLKGRTALITGGSSGIGYEIAKAFVNAGAEVVITGRNEEKLNKACCEIESSIGQGRVYGVVMNNANISGLEPSFSDIIQMVSSHQIDILVNNAGLVGGEIRECTEEQYDSILDTNLKGTFFLTQLVANYMKNAQIKGNILNIGSSSSQRPATSAYTISKWGIKGFTMGMAKALAPYGITVNAIAPGPTATPMLMKNGVTDDISFPRNPIGRYARPEEIANMAVFLTSEMGRSIVGDMIFMTGGAGVITYDDINYSF